VLDVREYIDIAGRNPFTKWLRALNVHAAAKVATALERVADGNWSNVNAVGNGVLEHKIDFGPRLTHLLRAGRRPAHYSASGWHEEAPTRRHPAGKGELGRLPE
jgi:hypothetical protein